MQTGENRALRWLEREREGRPVPLALYRAMRACEEMTPDELGRTVDGLDILKELHDAAGITGMSTQAALDAGLLTEGDVWGAFGIGSPERGPA
jgi:hypothetical protein